MRIEQEFSDPLPISGGSPQGTLLGNLIFIIATSDLDKDLAYSRPENIPVPYAEVNYQGAEFDASEVIDSPIRPRMNQNINRICLLYTSPSPRDLSTSRMPSSA